MISVVVPVFNRPGMAARAVRSVLAQRGPDSAELEIIVVDDASVPPLPRLDPDPRIKTVRLEKNSGPAAARNAGIRASRGDYIAFLDSDDVWLEDKIAHQFAALRKIIQENPDRLHALACGFYSPSRTTNILQARVPRPADHLRDFVCGCWFAPGSSLLIHRSAYDIVGYYDERLRRMEDHDWFIRFAQQGGQLHVISYLGIIIAPSNSASFEAVRAGTRIIEDKFRSRPEAASQWDEWHRLQAYFSLEHGVAHLQEGKRLRGLGYLAKSLWHKPRSQVAIEQFWERLGNAPEDVSAIHREMEQRG